MKAKLAKTKVTDSVTTGASASGPQIKNFSNAPRNVPIKRSDLPNRGYEKKPPAARRAQAPIGTPSTYKGKGDELSDEDSEDDIAAANEKMKAAALKF